MPIRVTHYTGTFKAMDAERLRTFLLTLPHVVETMQWGANLVFWTGDKAIGGKMFALINLDDPGPFQDVTAPRRVVQHALMMYSAGPARYSELLELEGVVPAPYMARIHWVAVQRWDIFTAPEWRRELRAAYDLTLAKLPARTRVTLALPAAKQKALIAARRKLLAAKAKNKAKKSLHPHLESSPWPRGSLARTRPANSGRFRGYGKGDTRRKK